MKALIQHQNRTIQVDQFQIAENALAKTLLSADMAAASGTLTVKNISGFAVGKFVWINPFGQTSEIVAMHASTAPSGTTLTLAANTVYAHSAGEEVLYVEFNQIEINHAATLTGSKSVLATVDIMAREKELIYLDVSQTTGYYFARYKNSVATLYGDYSDGVEYGGWDANTVGAIIETSLRDLSLEYSEKLTLLDIIRFFNEGLREIKGKVRRWPEHYKDNYVAGQISRGTNIVLLPSDIYDAETNASISALRFGNGSALRYLDPASFDAQMDDIIVTQVRTQALAADTTLAIDNSYDFEDSGTVSVYISGTKYEITYTGVTRSATTGILTGIPASGDGSITVTIPVDTYVWQNEEEGTPTYYTVRNGVIEFTPLADASHDNQNVYMDYNLAVTEVNSENDVIDYLRYDMLKNYVTWRIWAKAKNGGVLDKGNGFYTTYKEHLNDAIRTMPTRKTTSAPNVNRMSRRGGRGTRPVITPEYT
jgi:hypothetical protein